MKRVLAAPAVALAVAAAIPSTASAITKQDVTIRMSDGVELAATVFDPDDTSTGERPAVILLHGLGEHRNKLNAVGITTNDVAERYLVPKGYVALTFDQRGQGASGGLHGLASPRDVADLRELYTWLDSRPRVDGRRIGAYAYSGGGGTLWRALAEGIPFAAVINAVTWTDLYGAIVPQNLTKSGAALGYLNAPVRYAPELLAYREDLYFSRNLRTIRSIFDGLSVKPELPRIRVPTLLMQGRRDFLFDLTHAFDAYRRLAGPRRLYLSNFGHAPSRATPPEVPYAMELGSRWFDRWLRHVPNGVDTEAPVLVARESWTAPPVSFRALPRTMTLRYAFGRATTIRADGKVLRSARVPRRTETFGSGSVTLTAVGSQWSHLVAVVTARTPDGRTIVVTEGGVPAGLSTRPRTIRIRLLSTATLIPAGSRLELTLAGTSTAQDPGNLLYLVPVADHARLTVRRVQLTLPVLRTPISR